MEDLLDQIGRYLESTNKATAQEIAFSLDIDQNLIEVKLLSFIE